MQNQNRLITFFVNENAQRVKMTIAPNPAAHNGVKVMIQTSGGTSIKEIDLTVQEALHLNTLLDKMLISKF